MFYAVFMMLSLLSFFRLITMRIEPGSIPVWIWIIRLMTVPLAIWLGELWKDKTAKILWIYTAWIFLRVFLDDPNRLFSDVVSGSVLSSIWLFTSCYALGRILTGDSLKKFVTVFAFMWVAGIAVYSCFGIYTAWTGNWFHVYTNSYIETWSGRLDLVYPPTTTGSFLGMTVLIAIIAILSAKKKAIKVLFAFLELPILLALALTDSRTAYISCSAGIAIITLILIMARYKKNGCKPPVKAWLMGIIGMLLVFVSVNFLLRQLTPAFVYFRDRGLLLSARAEVMDGTPANMLHRDLANINELGSRAEVWSAALKYLWENPLNWLIGASKYRPLSAFTSHYAHTHNIFLQILIESGVPGLIMILSVVVTTLRNSCKILSKQAEKYIMLIPSIVLAFWIGDLAECFTWLGLSQCPMIAVLLTSIGIINNTETHYPASML